MFGFPGRPYATGRGHALIGWAVTFCSWHPVAAMVGVDRFVDRAVGATVQSGPSVARLRGIRAASAYDARGRSSHNPPVVGSSPTRPTKYYLQKSSKLSGAAGSHTLLLIFRSRP